ncbi:MAG: hypothetical protein NZZ41_01565 [Candidatus Dojkabacteria bacterium]|nr:hypothetical protein [Candidatus Dojkabacteria bacterium]
MDNNNNFNFIVDIPKLGDGIKDIEIRTFIAPINFESFSLISWVSFLAILITIVAIIYWAFLIIKASIQALQSDGIPDKLQEAYKRIRSLIVSLILSFLFPVILSLVGILFGIGNIFQWPKMFSFCKAARPSEGPIFYYQVFLGEGKTSYEDTDKLCQTYEK